MIIWLQLTLQATASWRLNEGPFRTSVENFGESSAVAMTNLFAAAGDVAGVGQVKIFFLDKNNNTWTEFMSIYGTQEGSLFGTSTDWDAAHNSFAVGAPKQFANGTATPSGAVRYYRLNKKGKAFRQLGVDILGDASIDSIGEDFGQSVAVSSNYRLVAGAPRSNYASLTGRGRIYTFQYQSNTKKWIPMQSFPITGEVAGDQLGTAVDMSLDGTVVIAGAIGRGNGTGVVMIYFWNGSQWLIADRKQYLATAELFGSSVKVLSPDGSLVAAGGPGFNNSAGVVRLFQRDTSKAYNLVAQIFGEPGDSLGRAGSLDGFVTSNATVIVASTGLGSVKHYEFSTVSFQLIGSSVLTQIQSSPFLTVGGSPTGNGIVVGANQTIFMYSPR